MAAQQNNLPEGGLGGEIGDEEVLARLVLRGGEYVDENNRIQTGALREMEFRKEDGWSFFRLLLLASGIGTELEKRYQKSGRRYGYALITAGELRAALGEAGRVVADPLEDSPAHALAQRTGDYGKGEAKSIRDAILPKFSEVRFD